MTPDDNPALRLGDLQLAILRVLWQRGEATVTDVHAIVGPERGSAASTIATMLSKMEARGFVAHRKSGRAFLYRAAVEEGEARRSMVQEVTSRMFGGDPLELVNHLVAEDELGADDLDAIRRMIDARTRRAPAPAEDEGGDRDA